MKTIEKGITVIFAVIMLWMLFSWVDVLCHNDPVYGDEQYHPCNVLVMMEKCIDRR